jgi:hypothetical protein
VKNFSVAAAKLIPDPGSKELMSSLPAGTPITLFCLDNSSFLAASKEGGLVPISKCVPEDDGYHVKGALVVAPECAIQHTLDLLKKVVEELSEYPIFIVSPIDRYIIADRAAMRMIISVILVIRTF